MPRMKEADYQFHSDMTSSGFKKYFNLGDYTNPTFILFEAKMSKKI